MKKCFVMCSHCGENFFKEDTVLARTGRVCTICAARGGGK